MTDRLTPERIAELDRITLDHLDRAEQELHAALRRMPNSTSSLFMATDARDLSEALRRIRIVSMSAEENLKERHHVRPITPSEELPRT